MKTPNRKTILLIDDDKNDRFLLGHCLSELKLNYRLLSACGVQEALDYLEQKRAPAKGAVHFPPDLLIVDLKMEPLDGFWFLQWRQSSRSLSAVPTVVFTDSTQESDVARALELKADEVFFKPKDFKGWKAVVREMVDWFEKLSTRSQWN